MVALRYPGVWHAEEGQTLQLDRVPYAILLGLGLVGCADRSVGDDGEGGTGGSSSGGTSTHTDETYTGPCLQPPWTDTETWGPCLFDVQPCLGETGPCLSPTGPCLDVTDTWTGPCLQPTDTWTDTGTGTWTGPCLDVTGTSTDTWTGPCLAPPTDTSTGTGSALREVPVSRRAVPSAADVLERILRSDILPADVAERLQSGRSPKG